MAFRRSEGLQTVRVLAPIPKHAMQWTPGYPTKVFPCKLWALWYFQQTLLDINCYSVNELRLTDWLYFSEMGQRSYCLGFWSGIRGDYQMIMLKLSEKGLRSHDKRPQIFLPMMMCVFGLLLHCCIYYSILLVGKQIEILLQFCFSLIIWLEKLFFLFFLLVIVVDNTGYRC